jgi:RNA polymerase sigma factor (sigma-70 family)
VAALKAQWLAKVIRRRRRHAPAANPASERTPRGEPAALPHAELLAALPRLRRYARVLTGDSSRADDLVQDTLTRAWEKRELWRPGSDLRAWLFTIMHNVHVNQFAIRRRERAESSLDADDGPLRGWEIPVRATQSDRVELTEVLMHIQRLPTEQREVLLLAAVEELRYEEIARLQGIPIGTVMSRLNRAREKLRRMLDEPAPPLKIIK